MTGEIRQSPDGEVNKNSDLQDSSEPVEKRVGRDGKARDTPNVSAANKARAKQKPSSPAFTAEAEDDLVDVLHRKPDADDRWQRRQQQGLSDTHLLDAIADELGTKGTHEGNARSIEYRSLLHLLQQKIL